MPPSRKRLASAMAAEHGGVRQRAASAAERRTRPISVWTDCSGLDAPLFALLNLRVIFKVLAGSDCDKVAQKFWEKHWGDQGARFFSDLTTRNHREEVLQLGSPDLYVAGFPCPTFSIAGRGQGASVPQGQIIVHIIAFLRVALPTVFVLENVGGLLHQHFDTLAWILQQLAELSGVRYHMHTRLMNSTDHGIPHNRNRLWIVGIRGSQESAPFTWPDALGTHVPLPEFLDPRTTHVSLRNSPTGKTARKNWKAGLKNIIETTGRNPLANTENFVMDIDGSAKWGPNWRDGIVPCLTRARSAGHWLVNRGRRVNTAEFARPAWAMNNRANGNPNKFSYSVPHLELGVAKPRQWAVDLS
eukprot:13255268-Heterocapsa_arctica.AAC.1